ncbi:RcnB family protein [Hyphomonas sp.]|uniref:RcnB family protein n=1 Tax=Hyphomonas sp. TaxID=87 RepID=UPI0025BFF033|nr:RcnB family protein [Hyphomonas sp.]MBI1400888.1 transmembrane signal peptide protein [Hyphomonas sp.]
MSLTKNFTRILAVATAASFILAPVAQADKGRGRGGDDHRGGYDRRGDDDYRRHGDHRRDDRHYDHRYDRRDYYRHDHHRRDYYRPSYSYYPRSSVTVTYGSSYGPYYYSGYRPRYDVGAYYTYGPRRTVYITDYNNYGLYEPPYGYHWVRDNDRGDAILASVATGAIIGLVIGALAYD